MGKTCVIAVPTTVLMETEQVKIKDPETRQWTEVTEPDAITFKIYNDDGVEIDSVPGNQAGSGAYFNASYTFETVGDYTWKCVIEKDDAVLTTRAERVQGE